MKFFRPRFHIERSELPPPPREVVQVYGKLPPKTLDVSLPPYTISDRNNPYPNCPQKQSHTPVPLSETQLSDSLVPRPHPAFHSRTGRAWERGYLSESNTFSRNQLLLLHGLGVANTSRTTLVMLIRILSHAANSYSTSPSYVTTKT